LKIAFLTLIGVAVSMTAFANDVALVKSPFPVYVRREDPRQQGWQIDGAKAGDVRTAKVGDKLLDISITATVTAASIEVKKELTLTSGSAVLNLATDRRVEPEGRIVYGGKTFYMIKTDPETSGFFSKDRYFAVAEDGGVLDHSFSSHSDGTYQTRETVSVTPGEMTVIKSVTLGRRNCSQSTVFLGIRDGIASFKVVRANANGEVYAQKNRAFTPDVTSISIAGARLDVIKLEPDAVRATVNRIDWVGCQPEI